MRKVISFSLWGANPKYTVGAIKNAELLESVYPGWVARFYVGSSVPNQIIYTLEDMKNVEVILKESPGDWSSMFWRFEACFDSDVDVVIFRDTDSRLNFREKAAVDEWLTTEKTFHIMRDHPYHKFPILGGMWGFKKSDRYDMKKMIQNYQTDKAKDTYGTDYDFLGNELFPLIREDVCIHDEFYENKLFPTVRKDLEFVGQVYDENGKIVKDHVAALDVALSQQIKKSFVSEEIECFEGELAEKYLSKKNDLEFLDDKKGIHKVTKERWKEAQKYEKKTWMSLLLHAEDDRNHDHLKKFNNFEEAKKFLSGLKKESKIIELGCGPFTNMRLLLEGVNNSNIKQVTLLDPLVDEYVNHPNCSYKNNKICGYPVRTISSTIEDMPIDDLYDCLLITNVLEHCYDVHKIFENIDKILKPGGMLIFSDVYFIGSIVAKIAENSYDAGHPIRLSQQVMDDFLKKFVTVLNKDYAGLYNQSFRNDKYFIGLKKDV